MASLQEKLAATRAQMQQPPTQQNEPASVRDKLEAFKAASNNMKDVRDSVAPHEYASVGDIATASLANDWRAQARYFAEQRGINPDQYRLREGVLGYEDSEGFHPEVPQDEFGSVSNFVKSAAQGVGPAIPAVGGLVGGLATAPVAGGVPGAVGGAAFGQAGREAIAGMVMDQDVSPVRILGEGAFEGAAQMAGALVAKGVSKTLASRAAKEIFRKINDVGMDQITALQQTARDMGFSLTPAELTNLPGLKAQQKVLQGSPVTSNKMSEDLYKPRGKKIGEAVDNFLKEISPTDSPEIAGENLQKTAQAAMDAIKAERAAKGSPIYQKAFDEAGPIDLEPVVETIRKKTLRVGKTTRQMLKTVLNEFYEIGADGKKTAKLRSNLEEIQDTIKEELDNQIGKAARSGNNKSVSALMDVKETLLSHLDDASPTYKEARAKWGDLSDEVGAVEGGVLAGTAKTKKLKDVARDLFNNGPLAINTARKRALKIDGGEEAWNGVVRAHLEDAFNNAKKVPFSSIGKSGEEHAGAKWWAQVFGDKAKRLKLKAALSADQYRNLRKMMDVLEATGRAVDTNSDTAFKQEALQEQRRSAGGGIIGNINVPGLLRKMEEGYKEMRFRGNMSKLADVITDPNAMERLNEIYTLSPRSNKAIMAVAHVLGWTATGTGSSILAPTEQYNQSGSPRPQGQAQ